MAENRQPPVAAAPLRHRVIRLLKRWPRALLLFSGGLDSALLLALGREALGERLVALTMVGPHTTPGEAAAACGLARRLKVPHLVALFDPFLLPDFRENTPQRCYACKQAILAQARQVAAARGIEAIWDGTNMDDLQQDRPGLRALQEAGGLSPWLILGLGKKEIRQLSRESGLPAAKAPESCLATRFPYHTTLSPEGLARVGRAEAWLRARGCGRVRLRVLGNTTRLELGPEDWPRFFALGLRRPFFALLNSLGFEGLELEVPGD
ncbi:MAG: ATP-dependent sacrificial sulfur transferase LarE [Desulfobaccales bacterium]